MQDKLNIPTSFDTRGNE